MRAFELKLVKQIVVASAVAEGAANDAFVRVERIDYQNGIKAKLRIHVQSAGGPKEKSVTVKSGADLYALSNERAAYSGGFEVAEINAEPGAEYVRFSSGRTLRLGEEMGGLRDDVWRTQIKHTIRRHLDKELDVSERGVKVLSLFFVDRVANYRDYDEAGQPAKGKFAEVFEVELAALAREPQYAALAWLKEPVERLHNGYFAKDKKGVVKDSREGRDTAADDDVYALIMQDKERLLSADEPLRFVFSHSALREGWDNPNVFQICTLNETRSAMKKRQEIGRGLRLPVDQDGKRVFDESINRLYVMANESYEDFARALQTEYEDECGVPRRAGAARRRRPHPAGVRPTPRRLRAHAAAGARGACPGGHRPAVVVPDRAPHPPRPRRAAQPPAPRGHADAGVQGALGSHQAQDDLSRRVRHRGAGAARRCWGEAHAGRREAAHPRHRRPPQRREGRHCGGGVQLS